MQLLQAKRQAYGTHKKSTTAVARQNATLDNCLCECRQQWYSAGSILHDQRAAPQRQLFGTWPKVAFVESMPEIY